MANPQLRLVPADLPPADPQPCADPVRRVFEHWAFMLGRSLRRCKLGPTRRAAILGALAMGYDEDTLLLVCDGIASHPLEGKPESMQDAMRELEWALATEARIERWARLGELFHARVAAEHQARQRAPEPAAAAPVDAAAEAAQRERCRQMALQMRGGRHGQ